MGCNVGCSHASGSPERGGAGCDCIYAGSQPLLTLPSFMQRSSKGLSHVTGRPQGHTFSDESPGSVHLQVLHVHRRAAIWSTPLFVDLL